MWEIARFVVGQACQRNACSAVGAVSGCGLERRGEMRKLLVRDKQRERGGKQDEGNESHAGEGLARPNRTTKRGCRLSPMSRARRRSKQLNSPAPCRPSANRIGAHAAEELHLPSAQFRWVIGRSEQLTSFGRSKTFRFETRHLEHSTCPVPRRVVKQTMSRVVHFSAQVPRAALWAPLGLGVAAKANPVGPTSLLQSPSMRRGIITSPPSLVPRV